jgi:hypothetical protein
VISQQYIHACIATLGTAVVVQPLMALGGIIFHLNPLKQKLV